MKDKGIDLRKQKLQEDLELKKVSAEAHEKENKINAEKINDLERKCGDLEKSQAEKMKLIQELETEVALKDQKIAEHKIISEDLRQNIAQLFSEKKELKRV